MPKTSLESLAVPEQGRPGASGFTKAYGTAQDSEDDVSGGGGGGEPQC